MPTRHHEEIQCTLEGSVVVDIQSEMFVESLHMRLYLCRSRIARMCLVLISKGFHLTIVNSLT
jgi:hypothetical protein